jgi:hypothetical protein
MVVVNHDERDERLELVPVSRVEPRQGFISQFLEKCSQFPAIDF